MEKTLNLKAQLRENTGSKRAAMVRRQGRIPAVLYGHKRGTLAISLDAHNLVEGLHHGHRLFDLTIGKDKEKAIIKDIHYGSLGKEIIHVDLMRVDVTERVKVMVPVEFKGKAKGIQEGGIFEEHVSQIEVECRVTEIPGSIVVAVKDLDVGDLLHASDLKLPAGVELVSDPSTVLAACHVVEEVKTTEELEAEEAAEPEVIGEVSEEAEPEQPESKGSGQ